MRLTEHLAELANPFERITLERAPGGWLRAGPGEPLQACPARVAWEWAPTEGADRHPPRPDCARPGLDAWTHARLLCPDGRWRSARVRARADGTGRRLASVHVTGVGAVSGVAEGDAFYPSPRAKHARVFLSYGGGKHERD